jgi:aminopeptidase YwaD
MKRLVACLIVFCFLLLILPTCAEAIGVNRAVDRLFAQGYPQRIERRIIGFKSTPLGFRWTGSAADNAAARYIASQMRAAGLRHVRLEAVPVDAWTFKGASVTVGSRVMEASSYPGVPATGAAGVTGQVVAIPNNASAADFDAAGDIRGKIALVNFDSADWWLNFPAAEAGLRGAKAVILIYDADYPGYHGAPNAFGSNDPGYSYSSPPIVWLPSRSAHYLKAHLPTAATVRLRSKHKFAAAGGVGYNVVGEYPGRTKGGKAIVFGSHHDAHFTGALDNTAAVVSGLTIAKAMHLSGYRPAHKIVFFSSTAEEWGYTNCNYDWLVGSTYAAQHQAAGWAGTTLAMLNLELPGYKDGSLWFTATQELKPWLEAEIAAHPKLVGPKGGVVYTPDDPDNGIWFSYNDQWPFAARGVPTVCSWTPNAYFWEHYYHTPYDSLKLLSWPFLKRETKFHIDLARSLDSGVLPYDLSAQADALATAAGATDFVGQGVDASVAGSFAAAVASYQTAASEFDGLRTKVPARSVADANANLLGAEKTLNSSLIGLGIWDNTTYPFVQPMADLTALNAAVAALQSHPIGYVDALGGLDGVGLTWYGTSFSYPVFLQNLRQHEPSYSRANMARLGHMPRLLDVMPEYRQIQAAQLSATSPDEAIASLKSKIDAERVDITGRLQKLTAALQSAVRQIRAATPPVAK